MALTFKTSWLPAKFRTVLLFQVVIFIVTFALYAAVHAVRKTLSNVVKPLKGIGYSKEFFGYMNSAFMLSYSLGMVFTGALGDKFRPTTVLLVACSCVAAVTITVGLLVTNYTSTSYWPLYIFLWVLSGLFQSCVWPVEVKLVSGWFGKSHSGALFGIWSANSSVGNILGIGLSAMSIALFGEGLQGVIWSFIIPTLLMLVVVAMVYIMPLTQTEAGFSQAREQGADIETRVTAPASVADMPTNKPKMSFWTAWCLPGVIRYGLCYACIKAVNYTIFYCLTSFLQDLGYETSVAYNITILNDVGWIFGGLACGWGSDWMGYRAPFVGLFILLAVIPTALTYPFVESTTVTAVLVTLNGFFAGGSGNVVASACCADIGSSAKVKKQIATDDDASDRVSEDLIGQVSGIVDGIGAFGAALTQIAVGYLSNDYIDVVFYSLAGMLLAAFILISDLVFRESREWARSRRHLRGSQQMKQDYTLDKEGVETQ